MGIFDELQKNLGGAAAGGQPGGGQGALLQAILGLLQGSRFTAAIIGRDDTLKVIDQGADDTTNAVSIRHFFAKVAGVATTTHTAEATVIQTRHRIPETPLRENQIIVYQVPIPEPCTFWSPERPKPAPARALRIRRHAGEPLRGVARHGHISRATTIRSWSNGRYIMSPSPIPKFDNPKLDRSPALQLYRRRPREAHLRRAALHAGQGAYDFDDHPFEIGDLGASAANSAAPGKALLDEIDPSTTTANACSSVPTPTIARTPAHRWPEAAENEGGPLLSAKGLTKRFGARVACRDVDFDLWPGEVLARRGRIRVGQDDVAELPGRPADAEPGTVSYRMAGDGGSMCTTSTERAAGGLLITHRMGVRAPEPGATACA